MVPTAMPGAWRSCFFPEHPTPRSRPRTATEAAIQDRKDGAWAMRTSKSVSHQAITGMACFRAAKGARAQAERGSVGGGVVAGGELAGDLFGVVQDRQGVALHAVHPQLEVEVR